MMPTIRTALQPDATAIPRPARPIQGRVLPRVFLLAVILALTAAVPPPIEAHPGDLDEWGGHFDDRTGAYHYHRPAMDMARRKREVLAWMEHPHKGALKATVARVERPNAVWVYIPYRPAFQELVPLVSKSNRDDKRQLVRIWLLYVSPEETGHMGAKFGKWFDEKVVYELRNKLVGKDVTVHFQRLGSNAQRLRGMVFLGEENVNLWLVLQGWSYYVLEEGGNAADKQFRQAEDLARKNKTGIWAHIK